MKELEERIIQYIHQRQMDAQHLRFNVSCHSVAEAAAAVGAREDELVKNICLLGPDGELAVAILRGSDRVDTRKAAQVLGLKKTRMATAEEILARTGFPCGGTPSFGFEAVFLMDEKVFLMPLAYTGGGSGMSLVKSTPQELRRANNAIIADIAKT
jgi:Cys-tRNA(Pro)/Cys-tRNA(Cys) deacylase